MNRVLPAHSFVRCGLLTISIGLMLACSGCVPFEGKFAAAGNSRDPSQPLSGRWVGTWTSDVDHTNGAARLVVETASASTCNMWLEMAGYRNVVASWIFVPDLPLQRMTEGTECFNIKVPIEGRPKQQVWAVAITLEGKLAGRSLTIRFRTNDAMRELDAGTISLTP